MNGIRSGIVNCVLIGVVTVVAADLARAQPARTRTLVYDPNRKDWNEETHPPLGTPEGDLLIKERRRRMFEKKNQ